MQVLNIFHVLIAIALIGFVLIQRGQGATAGAAFGSGASGTVFGARGAGNFLSRSTWVLAALFCAISLTMAVLVSRMMTTPEVGLGVVTAVEQAEPQPQEESLISADDAPVTVEVPPLAPAVEDMPAVESSGEPGSESGSESGMADDLPAVDAAVEAAVEETAEDDG